MKNFQIIFNTEKLSSMSTELQCIEEGTPTHSTRRWLLIDSNNIRSLLLSLHAIQCIDKRLKECIGTI